MKDSVAPAIEAIARREAERVMREHEAQYHILSNGRRRSLFDRIRRWLERRRHTPKGLT